VSGVSARMSRGYYEQTAPVEFKLARSQSVFSPEKWLFINVRSEWGGGGSVPHRWTDWPPATIFLIASAVLDPPSPKNSSCVA